MKGEASAKASGSDIDYLIVPNQAMHKHLLTLDYLEYTYFKIPGVHGWGTNAYGVHLFMDWLCSGGKKGKV